MIIFDTDEFIKLSQEFLQSGKALPDWLEAAVRRAKENEKEEQAFNKKMFKDAESKNKPFESKITNLFMDFENSIPEEFLTYKTPHLENSLTRTKDNIKQLANDIQQLSEKAGGNQNIENQAVKITYNLLDRLKNDLGFSREEKKLLENKTAEEIAEYYAQTRSGKMDTLNNSINGFRKELKDLENSCEGKPPQEVMEIYQKTLNEIESSTSDKSSSSKRSIQNKAFDVESINDVKAPSKTSQNLSEETIKAKNDKKSLLEISL